MRLVRVLTSLAAVVASVVAAGYAGEEYMGDRVFVTNGSPCDIILMEEHSGSTARPGGRLLAKSGFIENSPSMELVSKQQLWTGLHFRMESVSSRTRDGVRVETIIPAGWWKATLLGRKLTFEVNGSGDLVLQAPSAADRNLSQPNGFRLSGLQASIPMQKELACQ